MANPVKTLAVRTVKPLVGERTWQRLRALAPGDAPRDATPATPAPTEPLTPAQERRRRLRAMSLTELALELGTDKAGQHRYTEHYERHLGHLREEEFTLLEIGIGGYGSRRRGGESLLMWKWFFPRAQVVGLDIQDKSFVDRGRVVTYQGSQADEAMLRRIVDERGPIRVVVDDGSHRPEHVRESFRVLFPLLEDGGVYAIEDTQTSYWPEFGGEEDRRAPGTTMDLVKDLVDGLNHEEFLQDGYEPTYTDQNVLGVSCYHNLVFVQKGDNREGSNKREVLKERYGS